tara:strand:- start:1767 stop:2363 length:597 start_codon:yes stop_codon:yes gene_type:complete
MIMHSPTMSRICMNNKSGEAFEVRDVYHMWRDYNPLYRVRTALGLTGRMVSRRSNELFGRHLRLPQINMYEGLDWATKSIERVRVGGVKIDGLKSYCDVLEVLQDEVAPDGAANSARIASNGLMTLHLCWYTARDKHLHDYVEDPDTRIPREPVAAGLDKFRYNLQQELRAFMPEWEDLARCCELPEERYWRTLDVAE